MIKKKCIILSRVSTGSQELESQSKAIKKRAKELGYTSKDIIEICDVESAIKNSEEERNGIARMKQEIFKGYVDRVIVFEVSRIARRADVLFSVRDFLKDHHIQLTVLNPEMNMLDENGEISSGANLLFAMFGSMAESEFIIKKARFRRGKQRNASLGKFNGGKIKIGYRLGENRILEIDNETSQDVIYIYKSYADGKSTREIFDDFRMKGKKYGLTTIKHILADESYTGAVRVHEKCFDRTYPAIIPDALYNKVKDRLRDRNKVKQTNNYRLGAGVIICPECGRTMTFSRSPRGRSGDCYLCRYHTHKLGNDTPCNNACSISAVVIEKLLWNLTTVSYQADYLNDQKSLINDLEQEKVELSQKIKVVNDDLEKSNKRYERLQDSYFLGDLSDDKYNQFKSKLDDERKTVKATLRDLNDRLSDVIDNIGVLKEKSLMPTDAIFAAIENLSSLSKQEKQSLVRKYIKKVEVNYIDESNRDKVITVWTSFAGIKSFIKYYKSSKLFATSSGEEYIY